MQTTGDSQLIEKIFSLSRLMKDRMAYQSDLIHLSLLQLQTLLFLQAHPNIQMRDIATHFTIEMPTATTLIAKLVRMHLVVRQQDTEDRRLVRIMLTENGQNLLSTAMKERNKKLSSLIAVLPEKDKENLLRIISIIIAKMEVTDEK